MKTYELIFNEIDIISAVERPAVQSTLIAFSDEVEIPTLQFNEDKMVFYSVAMRPNKLIYRQDINGEPANVFYSPETVVKMQQDYFRKSNNTNTNLQHSEQLSDGIFPFESWIVENAESDKAIAMGLDVRVGDWVMGYKVDCPDIWQQVKEGKINGLSIESSNYKLNQINMNDEQNTFFEKVKALFASQPEVPAEETEDPTAELKAENEMLKQQVADLEQKLSDIQAEKVKTEQELVQMAKQTMSAQPIVNVPTVKFEDLTPLEKFRLTK